MAIPEVVGCYITIIDKEGLCIVIMAVKIIMEITKKISRIIVGHPVEIAESGEIKPL
jgi:hypothetical protein